MFAQLYCAVENDAVQYSSTQLQAEYQFSKLSIICTCKVRVDTTRLVAVVYICVYNTFVKFVFVLL